MAKDAKGHGSNSRGGLSVPEQHQFKIAKDTLRMSDAGAAIMGGMSKDQARAFLLSRGGWSAGRLAAHEGAVGVAKQHGIPTAHLSSEANEYNRDLALRIRDRQVGSGMKRR